jgi:hypothetical protein
MLKNCMYVGEVAYRGEVYPGEHGAIVESAVFNQVQAKLSERTVARRLKRSQSPHLLTGLIFDDAGHPMSPTHASKKGARYRYYVSHALLQGRNREAGRIPRVAAAEVESPRRYPATSSPWHSSPLSPFEARVTVCRAIMCFLSECGIITNATSPQITSPNS